MLRLLVGFGSLVALMLLGACGELLKVDEEALQQAQDAYAEFVLGKDDELFARASSLRDTPDARNQLDALRNLIPDGPAASAELVGFRNNLSPGRHQLGVTYRYRYEDRTIIFGAGFARANDKQDWDFLGFNVSVATPELIATPTLGEPGTAPPIKPSPIPATST